MDKPYRYEPRVLTSDRKQAIAELVDGLREEAAHDVENKREIYEALVDLLAARDIGNEA